ncbi:MAG: hypothetical protein R3F07_01320 [Opitutaceae bacterium]
MAESRRTLVSIDGDRFWINGQPTCPGRTARGLKLEGLLLNSRMVQATFDDLNPKTIGMWVGPDGKWDPEANTDRFLAMLPAYREAGLLGITVNFQGGSPQGYSREQPWHNSAFDADGSLRADYAGRMQRVIEGADALGMVVILGFFYFGQDQRLRDEAAVIRACREATDWICRHGFTNVVVEIGNEIDIHYDHAIIRPDRCAELIRLAQEESAGRVPSPLGRLLVGTSFSGGKVPGESVVAVSDVLLIHGNGQNPTRLGHLIESTRNLGQYRGQPIVINEDDHFDFDGDDGNFLTALRHGASWGYFDYRMKDEAHEEGFQSVPTDWSVSSKRKKAFFNLLAELTGSPRRF